MPAEPHSTLDPSIEAYLQGRERERAAHAPLFAQIAIHASIEQAEFVEYGGGILLRLNNGSSIVLFLGNGTLSARIVADITAAVAEDRTAAQAPFQIAAE